MEKTDLSHWDTVTTLEFGQAIRLALGVDPYVTAPLDKATQAKERLLRQQMSDAHLRAANFAHNFLQWVARNQPMDLRELFANQPPFIPMLPISPQRLRSVIGQDMYFALGPVHGLRLTTVELQHAFELACSPSYGVQKGIVLIADFGNLQDIDELDRETLANWFQRAGWKTEYNFGVFIMPDEDSVAEAESDAALGEARIAHPRTQKNYLALIAAMAIDKYGYESGAARSVVPGDLSALLRAKGVALTDEVIRGYLKDGAGHLNPASRK